MLDLIPFNMNYTFGTDLREVPEDVQGFVDGIGFLEKKVASESSLEKRAVMLSLLGTLQRIIGQLEESLENLMAAETLFKETGNEKLELVNSIRLGTTLQFLGRHAEATMLFTQQESKAQNTPLLEPFLDFIYQHTGKNHLEAGNTEKALTYFEQALELRLAKGKQDLLASSELACRIARKALSRTFPKKWNGIWQDKVGKELEIEGLGKGIQVTFRGGPNQQPFPLSDVPESCSKNLDARLEQREGFATALLVEAGTPEVGPKIRLEFFAVEDGQLRSAHFSDPIDTVSVRPSLIPAMVDELSPTNLSWVYPLFNYQKKPDK